MAKWLTETMYREELSTLSHGFRESYLPLNSASEILVKHKDMVPGMCKGGDYSLHGEQEQKVRKGLGTRNTLQKHTSKNQFPPNIPIF